MKVLVLSCFTGEGHNSAARAIIEELNSRNIECELNDPVSFASKRMHHIVSTYYNNMIKKRPSAFGLLYKAGEVYSSTHIKSPVYAANATYAQKLADYITSNGFDTVIATHLYGMEAMTAIRKKCNINAKFYGVLTDYTSIPFIAETKLDGYFVPNLQSKLILAKRGIPQKRIFMTGIPVSPHFTNCPTKAESRRLLSIPENKKVYVIMSGGIGGGKVADLCKRLYSVTDSGTLIYALVGRNEQLKESLDSFFAGVSRIKVIPFTTDVNLYMKAADVLLTKPGGLSSTEAAVINVPIVHVNAIPGCETYNVRYFSENGMSFKARNTKSAVMLAEKLYSDSKLSANMCAAQRRIINRRAVSDIVEIIQSL